MVVSKIINVKILLSNNDIVELDFEDFIDFLDNNLNCKFSYSMFDEDIIDIEIDYEDYNNLFELVSKYVGKINRG